MGYWALTMYLCDVNVWLAIVISGHVHHEPAKYWLDRRTGTRTVAFCRATQQSFLRLVTVSAIMSRHGDTVLTDQAAWRLFDQMLMDDRVSLRTDEPPGLEVAWRRFTDRPQATPKLWMDAYLAAFAVAGGYQLVTMDGGFRQFEGLDALVLGED